MTKQTNKAKYIPITVEAQQSDGSWLVRNTLKNENDEARVGKITRDRLIEIAFRIMGKWNSNYVIVKPLRIGGLKQKPVQVFEDAPLTMFEAYDSECIPGN